jgi:hypothetical protein
MNSLQLVGQLLARHVASRDQLPPLLQCLLPRHDNLPQPCSLEQASRNRKQPLRAPRRRCHDHDLLVRRLHRSRHLPQQPCLLRKRLQRRQGFCRIRCFQLVCLTSTHLSHKDEFTNVTFRLLFAISTAWAGMYTFRRRRPAPKEMEPPMSQGA